MMPVTSACVYPGPALASVHSEPLDLHLAGELGAGSRRIAGDPEARPGRLCRLAKVTHSCPGASAVQNPPTVWETQVQPLGWADHRERGMATHSSCLLAWRIPGTGEPGGAADHGVTKSQTHEHTHTHKDTQLDGGKAEFERTCCGFKEHPSHSSFVCLFT